MNEKLEKALNQIVNLLVSMEKRLNNGFVDGGSNGPIHTGLYETKLIGCCPQNNIIKSARTNVSKAYNSSTKQYLQSRCMTYDQKLSVNKSSTTVTW